MNIRDGIPTALTVVHLARDEGSCAHLDHELRNAGFEAHIEPALTADQLRERIDRASPQLLILDLPLNENVDAVVLDEISLNSPELGIHFRWLSDGEASPESLAESIQFALESAEDLSHHQWDAEELVRQQRLFLELTKVNAWEFQPAMERVSELLAEFFQVSIVGIWEFSPDNSQLIAIDHHDRREGTHCNESVIPLPPTYRESLSASLTLATHDALRDPRTSDFLESYLIPNNVTALLDVPIRRAGEVVGVICHEHVGDATRHWTPLDRSSAAAAAALVARALEVRDRRRDQERISQLERLQALGELSAGIAHDLNNMLGIVMGNLEFVMRTDSNLAPETSGALNRACDAADRVNAMITDLLAVGRGGPVSLETIELSAFLERLVPLLRVAVGDAGTLSVAVPEVPIRISADPAGCTRILVNLAKNAGEALTGEREGQVSIHLSRSEVPPGDLALDAGPYAVISVRDNGCGIEEGIRERLFEPFFSRRTSSGGTGLGLATSYGLAHQFGGTIRVESTYGEGSSFDWWIPLMI